ncbi:hypothetical protein MIND_01389800 [Mycena indigotica]|uniref:DNA helicase n=1 Tax=Mycena indigotica TaxID=2126181 RepID=A0A8H6RYM7_9AGAR|nr:uncharacterized protein MIND_01389800 [Mycena indigotica]KAF7289282.1 hypothetical protein MIND_01389800 [Mycena indigotica]
MVPSGSAFPMANGRRSDGDNNGNGLSAKGKGKARAVDAAQPVASTSYVDGARLALISEKEAELAAVIDRHDDLVREQFHLEKFKRMVEYDPRAAKQDDSPVFQHYKAQYDLGDITASGSVSPRRTRSARATLARLGASATPARRPPVSEEAPPLPNPPQRIVVDRVASPLPPAPVEPPPQTVSVKGKGKAKATQNDRISISSSASRLGTRSQSLEKSSGSKSTAKRRADPQQSHASPPPPRKRRKLNGTTSIAVIRNPITRHSPPTTSISAPVNGQTWRKQDIPVLPPNPPPPLPIIKIKRQLPPSTPPPAASWERRNLHVSLWYKTRSSYRSPPTFSFSFAPLAATTKTSIRIVAPRVFEHEQVVELVNAQTSVWARADAMKRAHQWFGSDLLDPLRPGPDYQGTREEIQDKFSHDEVDPPPTDAWSNIVAIIIERGREQYDSSESEPRKLHGQLIAAQVAARIQGYWDGEAARQEKRRVLEERRMRGVAKSVGKLVIAEWKKAVFHVRQQERLKLEAEELKRGHEHLDAILDQSGHILVTQHNDLTRGAERRTRSPSLSSVGHWDESESEEQEEESDEQTDDDDGESRTSERAETEMRDVGDEAVSSSALLGSWDTQAAQESDPEEPPGSQLLSDTVVADQDDVSGDNVPNTASIRAQTPLLEDMELIAVEEDSVEEDEDVAPPTPEIPSYLRPYAVAPVEWDPTKRVVPPLLLRGNLRPYQYSGLEWLASLHQNNLNGILADEMGLGKTIQTISLLAHLACDRGIWGPHLIVVPTSVLLNWEMEFKKFLPGFNIISYHGNPKRRQELRRGWSDKHQFNVCITSYTLASKDSLIFRRKQWYYLILDEAHMIKNFKSQRWATLLMFRSFRRLLLTGTPLQNNLTELWSLLQFLMSGSEFVNLKEFGDWFSNPLERAIEAGNVQDEDTLQRITKLHTVLRPYLLRRLKRDVEKELPSKFEHLVLCPLSKRQRFLYDEFMSRAHTRDALHSGNYQKIANILMQLRKVCNHPDLFEVRPIVTSFAMARSAVADFEIKELLVRRRLLSQRDEDMLDIDFLGLRFIDRQGSPLLVARETRRLDASAQLPFVNDVLGVPPPKDTRTIAGFRIYSAYQKRAESIAHWRHVAYINGQRCHASPIYSLETLEVVGRLGPRPLLPLPHCNTAVEYWDTLYSINGAVKSYSARAQDMADIIDRFAFCTPPVVALDLPRITLAGTPLPPEALSPTFDTVLHRSSVKLQIAFPDLSLLQYDCGKLQRLADLLREKKAGQHRVLIFTQMTRILDILEMFLSFHGYLYLRLDGATKIEDRQYITERFNADPRVFCFIASSRSGGVGINLTGADTVVFYDSDFNPQMDRQCEDRWVPFRSPSNNNASDISTHTPRAHRIGQIRDVHIYRFVSLHTVEEAMLRKANQKRSLDDLVIQKGEFDWRALFVNVGDGDGDGDGAALTRALEEFDDKEDAHAAVVAAREQLAREGQDEAEFLDDLEPASGRPPPAVAAPTEEQAGGQEEEEEDDDEGGSVADYMLAFVQQELEYFREWRV